MLSCSITKDSSGFSLIELMVVLVLVAILSGIALPAYTNYYLQVKRLEGRFALLEASLLLEKYKSTNIDGYQGVSINALGLKERTESGWYCLSITHADLEDYQIIATPTFKDKQCTQLSCNAKGQKNYKGAGTYRDCWGK